MAWIWLWEPGFKTVALSVNDDAAMRDAQAARDLVISDWYVTTFGIDWTIKKDKAAISNYGNTASGERLSKPSKAVVVGLRGDLVCIDDANDPLGAMNANERKEVNDLWDTNQYNRVNDPVRSLRIGVQQRVHEEDWTANVLKKQGEWSPTNTDGWLHVVLPAEYDSARKFVLPEYLLTILRKYLPDSEIISEDLRTTEGQTIDAERLPYDKLEAERKRLAGSNQYAGQMQQRPASDEGNKINSAWWSFFRLAAGVRDDVDPWGNRPRPAGCHLAEVIDRGDGNSVIHAATHRPGCWDFDSLTIVLDAAAKRTEKGSNWGLLVIGSRGQRHYVLDDATRKGALHEIIDTIKVLVRKWRPDSILVEDKAAGPSVMSELEQRMADGDIPMVAIEKCDPGNSDKEMRLEAVMGYIKNAMVALLDGADWLEEFVHELKMFPAGKNDDRVDCISMYLNWKREVSQAWPTFY